MSSMSTVRINLDFSLPSSLFLIRSFIDPMKQIKTMQVSDSTVAVKDFTSNCIHDGCFRRCSQIGGGTKITPFS